MKLLIILLSLISIVRPPYLKPGDKVAVISPSYAITDSAALRRGCEVLRSLSR